MNAKYEPSPEVAAIFEHHSLTKDMDLPEIPSYYNKFQLSMYRIQKDLIWHYWDKMAPERIPYAEKTLMFLERKIREMSRD